MWQPPGRKLRFMSDTPNLFRQLELDWNDAGRSRTARAALEHWGARDPALAAFETPADLVARCQERDDGDHDRDAILAALLVDAGTDPWAVRTLLQALLPGLASVARRATAFVGGRWPVWNGLDELDQHVVVVAYERITIVSLERPVWVARAIVDGTWQRVRAYARRSRRQAHCHAALAEVGNLGVTASRTAAEELAAVLSDAVKRGRIERFDAGLIYRSRLAGERMEDLARGSGLDPRSLWRRRVVAETALIADALGIGTYEARGVVAARARG